MSRYEDFAVNKLRVVELVAQDAGDITISSPLSYDSLPTTSLTLGAKNGATVSAAEYGDGILHKTVLTLTATPVTVADDAGVAQYGGCGKIYDFPTGGVAVLGGSIAGSCTMGATGTFIDNWTGGMALGSAAATTGSTLTGTEANLIPQLLVDAGAADKIGVIDSAANNVVGLVSSGTDAYLNLVIADDATHTAGTGTFTGTVTILWVKL